MTVSREELAAFADDQLGEPRRSQVAAEVAQDEALAAEVERHRGLKTQLAAHFAPILDQPVPDRLASLLGASESKVADFTTARQKREARRGIPRWGWIAGPALAASLALAVILPGGGAPEGYAGTQLAAILDERLVAEQAPGEDVRVLLSFRDDAGAFCRAFTGAEQSGIACRDETGWKLQLEGAGSAGQGTDYRMAGADAAEIMARAQEMAAGPALDAADERAARDSGWR
jgi:hypothetical protein